MFTIPKALLCNSSAYFKAALNGPFIEGQTQTIDLDDEEPSIFRTYVAWLYQGQLNSQDIEEALDDPHDFDLHIAELIVFADKRDICELKNDAISMLLNYLHTVTCPAAVDAINYIYNMPRTTEINELRRLLAYEEVWFGQRLEKKIDHWHPEFLTRIIKVYKRTQFPSVRLLDSYFMFPTTLCASVHRHTPGASNCLSLMKNRYNPAPPRRQQPPSKKRKIGPSTQNAQVLID